MKLITGAFLFFLLAAGSAFAQEDLSVFRVTDVAVDVTADNASQVRDKAIAQAQRVGFEQLLSRLGAEGGRAAKATDDGISSMVKALEVQKEHVSAKRYTGMMTVQFKPEAVRSFLDQKGVAFTEARAKPLVVLPVLQGSGRSILWEDRTLWRDAWDALGKTSGLVPLIVPAGEMDDIAKISTEEALAGKADSLQGIMQKYGAGGALVAVLHGDLTPGKTGAVEASIEAFRFDADGLGHDPVKAKLGPVAPGKPLEEAMKGAVKKVVSLVEADWRQRAAMAAREPQPQSQPQQAAPVEAPSVETYAPETTNAVSEASAFLPIDVPVPTLAAWAQIKNKLSGVASVTATHVVSMTRGLVHIELQFRGDISALQSALMSRGLRLEQSQGSVWELRSETAAAGMY